MMGRGMFDEVGILRIAAFIERWKLRPAIFALVVGLLFANGYNLFRLVAGYRQITRGVVPHPVSLVSGDDPQHCLLKVSVPTVWPPEPGASFSVGEDCTGEWRQHVSVESYDVTVGKKHYSETFDHAPGSPVVTSFASQEIPLQDLLSTGTFELQTRLLSISGSDTKTNSLGTQTTIYYAPGNAWLVKARYRLDKPALRRLIQSFRGLDTVSDRVALDCLVITIVGIVLVALVRPRRFSMAWLVVPLLLMQLAIGVLLIHFGNSLQAPLYIRLSGNSLDPADLGVTLLVGLTIPLVIILTVAAACLDKLGMLLPPGSSKPW